MSSSKEIDLCLYEWHDQCQGFSFWHQMVKMPEYTKLMEIGQPVVSRILYLLSKGEIWIGFSFLLASITKERPKYEPEKIGTIGAFKVSELAQSWIDWAKDKNIKIPKE